MVRADARLGADRVPVGARGPYGRQQETAAAVRSVWAHSMEVTREVSGLVAVLGKDSANSAPTSSGGDTDLCSRLTPR